jgi:hypothetical protein
LTNPSVPPPSSTEGPLERIAAEVDAFRRSLDDCRGSTDPFIRSERLKKAHIALGTLWNRYKHEKEYLNSGQRVALEKVFEKYKFIQGMMELRRVAEHVTLPEGPLIYTIGNAPVQLTPESSALAVFAAPIVRLPDDKGTIHEVDHLQRLEVAERRIGDALAKARLARARRPRP